MGEKAANGKLPKLHEAFPFMSAFPFGDYIIKLEREGQDPLEMGISPILVNNLGTLGTGIRVGFFYQEGDASVMVSFFEEDIRAIHDEAARIKKLNSVREELDFALESNDLEVKAIGIKANRKFVTQLDMPHLSFQPFGGVLEELIKVHEVSLTSNQKLGLQQLSTKKMLHKRPTENEETVMRSFLNFRLNYIKIVLGIVISAKIY
jgi:hypothetical protein